MLVVGRWVYLVNGSASIYESQVRLSKMDCDILDHVAAFCEFSDAQQSVLFVWAEHRGACKGCLKHSDDPISLCLRSRFSGWIAKPSTLKNEGAIFLYNYISVIHINFTRVNHQSGCFCHPSHSSFLPYF